MVQYLHFRILEFPLSVGAGFVEVVKQVRYGDMVWFLLVTEL